jgi:sulfopyruvate decarboxylase TPP-binding subunit
MSDAAIFTGAEIVEILQQMETTHVVALPDSTFGLWEDEIRAAGSPKLVRVCREGEAWAIAAGLYLGGANPLVMIQCTGLFESGDALRNAIHDYRLPLFAMIGYRSYLSQTMLPNDSARKFTEPIVRAWDVDYRLIDAPEKKPEILEHYRTCRAAERPGFVLIAEGRG